MGLITSIETCKSLVGQNVFIPAKTAIDNIVSEIPTISTETEQIFKAILYKPYQKYPEAPNLSRQFSQLQLSLKELEEAKSSKKDSSGSVGMALTYAVSFLVLHSLNFSSWTVLYGLPALPSIGMALYVEKQNENSRNQLIRHKSDMVKIWQKHACEATSDFMTFFKDQRVVGQLKQKISEVIASTQEDSTQGRIYRRALGELESCCDFCTVFSDEHMKALKT